MLITAWQAVLYQICNVVAIDGVIEQAQVGGIFQGREQDAFACECICALVCTDRNWFVSTVNCKTAYPVGNVVAVDGVVDQVQVGGIVQRERPKCVCWHRQRTGDGVVVAG